MGNRSISIIYNRRMLALFLAVLLPMQTMPLSAQACQQCAASAASGVSSLGSSLANTAGTTSVATGNSNMSQGQSTQNQAQTAMGAMQIAMGLLGLLAALAAAKQANKDNQNASNMTGLNDTAASYPGSTSPTPTATTSSGNIANGSSGNSVDITAEKLHSGEVTMALGAIEKQYGIPGDKFMDALKNGVDPKDIFANAPKNPVPMDALNKISSHLAANNTTGSDAAARLLASANATDLAGGLPTPSDNSVDAAGGAKPASAKSEESFDTDLGGLNVSPEVKAAMLAKSEEIKRAKEAQAMNGWSIFQLVHSRYQKLETMIYGRVERTNPNPSTAVKD
jgi:hypothetical protein